MKLILEGVKSQLRKLQKEIGQGVTDEQIASAVEAYMEENPVEVPDGTGLTDTEKTLILTLFRNAAYTSADMAETLNELETLWGASADSGDETHTHSYTSSVTAAATCETVGVRTYTCTCGASYTEEIPATGHTYVDGTCSVCGAADPDYEDDSGSTESNLDLSDANVFTSVTLSTDAIAKLTFSSKSGSPSWDDLMTLDAEKLYFYFVPYNQYRKTMCIVTSFTPDWGAHALTNTHATVADATSGTYSFLTNGWDKYDDGGYIVFEIDVAALQATVQALYDDGTLDSAKEKVISIYTFQAAAAESTAYLLYNYNE